MTPRKLAIITASILTAAAAAGCSANNSLSTASVTEPTAEAAKHDPACIALASQIAALRQEGTVERLEKAASGKTTTVRVKREALAKQAELNTANAEFQARCAPKLPATTTAQAAPAKASTTTAQASTADAAPPQPKN